MRGLFSPFLKPHPTGMTDEELIEQILDPSNYPQTPGWNNLGVFRTVYEMELDLRREARRRSLPRKAIPLPWVRRNSDVTRDRPVTRIVGCEWWRNPAELH
jgi:hypothetical protein